MRAKACVCFMVILMLFIMQLVLARETTPARDMLRALSAEDASSPAFSPQGQNSQTPEDADRQLKYWKERVKALEGYLNEPGHLWMSRDGEEFAVETDIKTIKEGIMLAVTVEAWQVAHDPEVYAENFADEEARVTPDIIETTDRIYDRLIKENEEIKKHQLKELERLKDYIRELEENVAELTGRDDNKAFDPAALDKQTMLGELDVIRQKEGWHPDDHVLVANEINSSRTPEALRSAGTLIIDFSKCYQKFNTDRDKIIKTAKEQGWMPGQRITAIDKATAELKQCKNEAYNRHGNRVK